MSLEPKVFPGSIPHIMSEYKRIAGSKSKAAAESSTNPTSLSPVPEINLAPPAGYNTFIPTVS